MKKPLLSTLNRRFLLALALSMAFHAALLFIHRQPFFAIENTLAKPESSELQVRLVPQQSAPATELPIPPAVPVRRTPKVHPIARLTPQPAPEVAPRWSAEEREQMRRFMEEMQAEARPRSGQALRQRALEMARSLGVETTRDDEAEKILRRLQEAQIDPFNIELYYEALFRKLNQSAAMERNPKPSTGTQVALVRVVLNPDGSLRRFNVLYAGDQQNEIEYIRSVVERAAPFPAFPPQIRKATDEMIMHICIQPRRFGKGSGPFFSRLSRGQGCQAQE